MSIPYDAIVVGARVAGSMTALHLARKGHRVLIVDRAGPPADTLSTHGLMRTAVLQLSRSGLLDAVVGAPTPPVTKITLGFDDEPFTIDVKPEFGVDALYAPRRTILDSIILDAAAEAGADVQLGVSVTDLSRDDADRVNGVVLGRGSSSTVVPTQIVVGADGRNSTVARLVDAPVERSHPATNAGLYSYFEGMPDIGYDFRFAPRMSTTVISTNHGATLVFSGVPTEDFVEPEQLFHSVLRRTAPDIADLVKDATRVERFHLAPGIPSFLRTPIGPGWVLVGDAGFTKDPLSAHGISCALRDAELAASAIHLTLSNRETEAAAGHTYRAIRNRFAIPLLDHTIELASYRWDAAGASSLMRALGRVTDAECAYLTDDTRHDLLVA